jgi:oligosaccharide repeat unit polymerase
MQLLATPNLSAVGIAIRQSQLKSQPLLGIATTSLGTIAAIALVPANLESNWALFASAVAMAMGLAFAPVAAAIRNPKSLLLAEHILVLSPIFWLLLDLLQGIYSLEEIEAGHVQKAFVAIGVFAAGVWAATLGRQWSVPGVILRSVSQEFPLNTYFYIAIVSFVLGMLNFLVSTNFNVVAMFSYLGVNRWSAPWARGQLGGWNAFLDHVQYFGYLLPALTVIIGNRAGWRNYRTLVSVGMAIVMALFLSQGGGRRIVGVIFGMAFILWILSQQRLRIRQVVGSALGVAALLAFMQIMVQYRNVGLGQAFADEEAIPKYRRVEKLDHLHVDDNFYRLSQIIQFIPESYPYVYDKYIIYILVRPIPRVLWPGKPVDAGFDLPTALGITGISLSSSVIGELYMSLGLIGVLLGGLVYGRLAGMASKLLTQGTTFGALVIYSIMLMALFAGMRSMLELVLTSYVLLAWVGVSTAFIYFKGRHISWK